MKTKIDYEIDAGCLAQIAATLLSADVAHGGEPLGTIDDYLKKALEFVEAAQDFLDAAPQSDAAELQQLQAELAGPPSSLSPLREAWLKERIEQLLPF